MFETKHQNLRFRTVPAVPYLSVQTSFGTHPSHWDAEAAGPSPPATPLLPFLFQVSDLDFWLSNAPVSSNTQVELPLPPSLCVCSSSHNPVLHEPSSWIGLAAQLVSPAFSCASVLFLLIIWYHFLHRSHSAVLSFSNLRLFSSMCVCVARVHRRAAASVFC